MTEKSAEILQPPQESKENQELRAKGADLRRRKLLRLGGAGLIFTTALGIAGKGTHFIWKEVNKETASDRLENQFNTIFNEYKKLDPFNLAPLSKSVQFGWSPDTNTTVYMTEFSGQKYINYQFRNKNEEIEENFVIYTNGRVDKLNWKDVNEEGQPQKTKLSDEEIDKLTLRLENDWVKHQQVSEELEPEQKQPQSEPESDSKSIPV